MRERNQVFLISRYDYTPGFLAIFFAMLFTSFLYTTLEDSWLLIGLWIVFCICGVIYGFQKSHRFIFYDTHIIRDQEISGFGEQKVRVDYSEVERFVEVQEPRFSGINMYLNSKTLSRVQSNE